ncbi:hypothetical protein QBC36DRAFT_374559 [Triangularia setosa]|uniref:Uncharacterized protein n=1 Tax=Triangularia setosa TaxID=2587417 RepID=A0AAN7ACI2_9PEZI|nr:hypothetical protein QBC36DRAFT_374559 [Podospora setosa]
MLRPPPPQAPAVIKDLCLNVDTFSRQKDEHQEIGPDSANTLPTSERKPPSNASKPKKQLERQKLCSSKKKLPSPSLPRARTVCPYQRQPFQPHPLCPSPLPIPISAPPLNDGYSTVPSETTTLNNLGNDSASLRKRLKCLEEDYCLQILLITSQQQNMCTPTAPRPSSLGAAPGCPQSAKNAENHVPATAGPTSTRPCLYDHELVTGHHFQAAVTGLPSSRKRTVDDMMEFLGEKGWKDAKT